MAESDKADERKGIKCLARICWTAEVHPDHYKVQEAWCGESSTHAAPQASTGLNHSSQRHPRCEPKQRTVQSAQRCVRKHKRPGLGHNGTKTT